MASRATERRVRASMRVRIAEPLLPSALLRLRHDQGGPFTRWTLGDLGSVEIDRWFTPAGDGAHRAAGWLLGPRGDVVRVDITATSTGGFTRLTLRTVAPLPLRWERQPADLRLIARAAVSELAEELRWQASRTVPATT